MEKKVCFHLLYIYFYFHIIQIYLIDLPYFL
jgi:hypothetical protein